MSSTFKAQTEKNVKKLLIRALILAETNVINADKDVQKWTATVNQLKEKINQVRAALAALGHDKKEA
jgi:outer membrane murein-binding lipoprotein Lpp